MQRVGYSNGKRISEARGGVGNEGAGDNTEGDKWTIDVDRSGVDITDQRAVDEAMAAAV